MQSKKKKKLNIQKTKIMASGPITSWEIDGETVETVSDYFFWIPKKLYFLTPESEFHIISYIMNYYSSFDLSVVFIFLI